MATPVAGNRIGPYELVAPLGAGGMGEVWKARDSRLDRTVAIKFSKAQFSRRFDSEARAIAALNHPNIAQIYDVGENYIVMEYVDGEPVRPPGEIRKLLDIAVQIADGLSAAHASGIVHRDLKPANIMMTKGGRAKILDFGLARQGAADAKGTEAVTMTQPGSVMGTAAYMSPEQARGQELDARSDQFSFGIILYELAAGVHPFRRATAPELMTAIIREEPASISSDVPAPLRWVIERLLSKDPIHRYESTRDLYAELRGMSARISELSAPAAPIARPVRQRVSPSLAAIVLLALISGALLWSSLSEPPKVDPSRFQFAPFAATQASEGRPVWSPDGQSIAYVATFEGQSQIMVGRVDRRSPATPLGATAAHLGSNSQLTWSPDGERLYYAMYGQNSSRVVSVSRAGGEPAVVLDSGATPEKRTMFEAPALSPDGRTLAVLVTESHDGQYSRHLMLSSPPGAAPKPVGEPLPCCISPNDLSWSPDSSRLLLRITQGYSSTVFLVSTSGKTRILAQIPRPEVDVSFSWIPGTRYAVTSSLSAFDKDQGLHLLDTESGRLSPFLPSASPLWSPSVSPDGSRVAYVSRQRQHGLIRISVSGASSAPLLPSNLDQHSIAYSPKRNEFVFVRLREMIVHDGDRNEERVLLSSEDFPKAISAPSLVWPEYSPDGQRIIFTCAGCERELTLWMVPVSGGTPARVAVGGAAATWSPDGQWIAYMLAMQAKFGGLVKLRVGSGQEPAVVQKNCAWPSWSTKGILCQGPSGQTLVAPEGTVLREYPVTDSSRFPAAFAWSRDGGSFFRTRGEGSRMLLERIDADTGRMVSAWELPRGFRASSPMAGARLSLSADGGTLGISVVAGDSDIWILHGFQPPRSVWAKIWPLTR